MLDLALLRCVSPQAFTQKKAFPWIDFHRLLDEEAFTALCEEFPPVEAFESHRGLKRVNDQRPHDRLYLAYEESIYRKGKLRDGGIIGRQQLSPRWARFLEELSQSTYLGFIRELLGEVHVRYAWHRGFRGSEVSPHHDGPDKLGTHIFYFNTREEWNPAWGGETLVLSGKSITNENPDFRDFSTSESVACFDNHSFLFQNSPHAWHGVKALDCPEGTHRKLFNVIFERPKPKGSRKPRGLIASAKNWLGRSEKPSQG